MKRKVLAGKSNGKYFWESNISGNQMRVLAGKNHCLL